MNLEKIITLEDQAFAYEKWRHSKDVIVRTVRALLEEGGDMSELRTLLKCEALYRREFAELMTAGVDS